MTCIFFNIFIYYVCIFILYSALICIFFQKISYQIAELLRYVRPLMAKTSGPKCMMQQQNSRCIYTMSTTSPLLVLLGFKVHTRGGARAGSHQQWPSSVAISLECLRHTGRRTERIACIFIYSTKWLQHKNYECQKYEKKSLIHENADANITCDFGAGDIRHYMSRFSQGQMASHIVSSVIVRLLDHILPTDPHENESFGFRFLRLWHVNVHLVSVEVSVERVAHTLVEAKGSERHNLRLQHRQTGSLSQLNFKNWQ